MAMGPVSDAGPRSKLALCQPRDGDQGVGADPWGGPDSPGGSRHLGSRVGVWHGVAPRPCRLDEERGSL